MTITEFISAEKRHFVAMEYYWVMFNRTFLVLLLDDALVGLKVNGLVSVEGGNNVITRAVTHTMAVQGALDNPYSYIKSSYVTKYEQVDVNSPQALALDKDNFRIAYRDITDVAFDARKKGGMGPYPHDGRVLLTTRDGKKRELIILGNQSGEEIQQWISATTKTL